ncbi:MAG: adenylyltransferase/cytidyltransferase family protein [Candidatus Dojkabacteria bacterium]|jgi:glycerol-3-phosphate cytidylyltransferase/D-beta-D-heptose 7-phosphate kinase/D-beta-D-heptose 1-phosphate adenosyltransferase|nr:adenylyltransferase/cytidyltransferase family protein [Candidatus Dojkabacteria bacterium]MDD2270451.1 adenylyltransferase/cytidyltransferase family protein [Candidatus Dojkabacteria bacterium]
MIIPIEDFPKLRESELKGKTVVATSGFFDPIHPGHASCLVESKKFGDVLVVILDGDQRAKTKKGKSFMPEIDRARVVDYIKEVDYVVIYNHPTRNDCVEAVEIIRPDVFTKGGDRDGSKNVPEFDVVEKYGGRVEFNVGDPKMWSSSNYLQEWVDFVNSKEE